jgi:dihydroflavonol-4-reductase
LKQTVLITGANGLLGSALVKTFFGAGYQVKVLLRPKSDTSLLQSVLPQLTVLEGDILDIPSLEDAIQPNDLVVHAAATVSFAAKDQVKMLKVNAEGTANVVNVCLSQKASKLLYISSVAALGRPAEKQQEANATINEDQKWEESPNNSFYAKTKYLAECEVWRGIAEGLNAVMLCPSVVLGEGDWNKSSTQLFKYVWNENKFFTSGNVNYVDAQDVATIGLKLVEADVTEERFVVSAGSVPYEVLFQKIAKALGKKAPSIMVKPWQAEIIWRLEAIRTFFTRNAPLITKETAHSSKNKYFYDATKLKKLIDFEFTPLDETLERVGAYFKGRMK